MKQEVRWVKLRLTTTGLTSGGGQATGGTAGLLEQSQEATEECGDEGGHQENPRPAPPLAILNNIVPTVHSFRFLGSTSSQGRACMYARTHASLPQRRHRAPFIRPAAELTHIITDLHVGF